MKKLFLLLSVLVLALPVFAQEDTVVEEIVARVNNSIITRADLRRSHETMIQEVRQGGVPDADKVIAEREKNLLRDLIDQQLLIQRGLDEGITGDAELVKRLDELRKQLNATTMDDLERKATEQGVSFEDFKQNMKNNIITGEVIRRDVGGKIFGSITREDVSKWYEEHKKELDRPEQVRLSEILIPATPPQPAPKEGEKAPEPPAPTAEQLAAAEATAKEALEKLQGGAKFEDVAKQFSKGPTAAQGGDLGYFKRGILAKELEDKTFALKPGDHTDVIRTKQGFVILQATDHQQAGIPALAEIEPRIQEQIYYQRLEPEMRSFLNKLREDAYIDVKQGYLDSGAIASQSKPMFVNASDDKEKQQQEARKRKKRFILF